MPQVLLALSYRFLLSSVPLVPPMNNVYSKVVLAGFLGSQGKAGKVFKDPLVLQSVVHDFDQLSC